MRTVSRLLASVKPARFLEAGNPTGLTGLYTHAAPRSTLLFLYGSTLDKLKAIPEHSVYRQSVERLIQHRMKIVESITPKGYDEWNIRAKKMVEEHPDMFQSTAFGSPSLVSSGGSTFVYTQQKAEVDERYLEWDGEDQKGQVDNGQDLPLYEVDEEDDEEHQAGGHAVGETSGGLQPAGQRGTQNLRGQEDGSSNQRRLVEWEPEPQLEASQIEEMENQIGAGLIEEVIQVAEGELKLVDTMIESKVWEELEEAAPRGQWEYFTLDRYMPTTQESPK